MPRIALVTAVDSLARDEDMPALLDACAGAGLQAEVRAWDDGTVSWGRYDAAVLRSPYDYIDRLPQFLRWCERVDRATRLVNPLAVLRWNTDKRYLADLAAAGLPVVPTHWVLPDAEPLPALQGFLAAFPDAAEFVVKPTVGAGSSDAWRYRRDQDFAAANHLARLLDAGRAAMLQPYLEAVDTHGETALLYFDGVYSHAIGKAALLRPDGPGADHLDLPGAIAARDPAADERAVADAVIVALHARTGAPLAYARVDLVRGGDGAPHLLELELTEPSLFFAHAPGAAARFAAVLAARADIRASSTIG